MPGQDAVSTEWIGAKIRRIRMERGLTQDRLAIEANVDQSGLSKLERGKDRSISVPALARIATVLKITLDELISGTNLEKQR